MGFDIYGKNGNSFRHTVSAWYPLWGFVKVFASLDETTFTKGLSNDFNEIEEDIALTIADKLDEYIKTHNKDYKINEDFVIKLDSIKAFSTFSRNSGGFCIS